jgi:hypothetical protein
MTESFEPKTRGGADKARDAYRKTQQQFQDVLSDTHMPEAMRAFAEKNIAQTRALYERSKDALETVLESWEKTFDAAGQGAVALNRKGFDLAKSLAGAKTLAEAMELHAAYWQKQLSALSAQAEEMRSLSTKVTEDVAEPIKTQVSRGTS